MCFTTNQASRSRALFHQCMTGQLRGKACALAASYTRNTGGLRSVRKGSNLFSVSNNDPTLIPSKLFTPKRVGVVERVSGAPGSV